MTAATETGAQMVNRVLIEAAEHWGRRAKLYMVAGHPEMAYEVAYTAAHCARLALKGQCPLWAQRLAGDGSEGTWGAHVAKEQQP